MLARGVVLLMFICLAAVLFLTALCGREYAKSGATKEKRDDRLLKSHKVCAAGSLLITVFAVIALELAKGVHGALGGGMMRSIHLAFIIPFFFLFIAALVFFTGERTPRAHYFLVYPGLVFFAVAFIAGAVMLLGIAS